MALIPYSVENVPEISLIRVPFGLPFCPENIFIDDFIIRSPTHLADILSRPTQVHFYPRREEYLQESCPFNKVISSRKRKRSVFEIYSTYIHQNDSPRRFAR